MQIGYLREFVALVEAGSYTEAARGLYITQSTLSKHIAAIESELGAELFTRNAAGMRLTRVGRMFHTDAVAILNVYDMAVERIEAAKAELFSIVRIGYLRDAALRYLRPLSAWFLQKHPEVDLQFVSIEHRDMASALKSYRIDVALTMDADPALRALCNTWHLYDDTLVVALPPGHRLAKREAVTFEDLGRETLLVPDKESWPWIRSYVEESCPAKLRDSSKKMSDPDTLFHMIEAGRGVAVVASHNEQAYGARVEFRTLGEERVPTFPVSAMWLKETELHVNASRGIALLKEALSQTKPGAV